MQTRDTSSGWTRNQVLMAISFFAGWMGLDRFYQQQVGWGILKLVTLGGLGLWWLIYAIYYAYQAGKT